VGDVSESTASQRRASQQADNTAQSREAIYSTCAILVSFY